MPGKGREGPGLVLAWVGSGRWRGGCRRDPAGRDPGRGTPRPAGVCTSNRLQVSQTRRVISQTRPGRWRLPGECRRSVSWGAVALGVGSVRPDRRRRRWSTAAGDLCRGCLATLPGRGGAVAVRALSGCGYGVRSFLGPLPGPCRAGGQPFPPGTGYGRAAARLYRMGRRW